MATYSVAQAKTATLVANVVDQVTATGAGSTLVIINQSSTAIYFTVGYTGTPPSAPTVAGDNSYLLPGTAIVEYPTAGQASPIVQLISTAAATYTVELMP